MARRCSRAREVSAHSLFGMTCQDAYGPPLTIAIVTACDSRRSPPRTSPGCPVSCPQKPRLMSPGLYMPRLPSRVSRMMSACPACRAVSSIKCRSTQRTLHSMTSVRAHGASSSLAAAMPRDTSVASR